ncbi:hypothetical protein [Odoribacter lunatus]|uniref:hypothetical protein n=1 Tax=Odoribacter lunatus TaxID=2941335 RepID=UPI00203FA90B|nr:hypothetical protein [Odoribacter lunatus]
MKKFILSIIAFVFIFSICGLLPVQAGDDKTVKEDETTLHLDTPINRPRMPSKISIHCTYRNGEVRFSFPEELEYLTVTIEHTESKTTWMSRVGHEDCMLISTANGTYNVSAQTEGGQHFSGTLYVTD